MSDFPVTVVIPTFNRADFLQESIASILAQTLTPRAILVVDDGSTDATGDIIKKFGARIDYIGKPNGGKSSALNVALGRITTDFVWIFDDDDIAAPNALENMAAGLVGAPECGFSYGSYKIFTMSREGVRQVTDSNFPSVAPDDVFRKLLQRNFIHQPGLLVRRTCYETVGPFDERLIRSQDYEMILRLARRFRGIEVPGPIFFQRKHDGIRGTAGTPIQSATVTATWNHYSHMFLREVRDTCALEDFLPEKPASLPLSDNDRFGAFLVRSTGFGRRGFWDMAADDLDAAVAIADRLAIARLTPAQTRVLQTLFARDSHGADEFPEAGAPFRNALGRIVNPTLSRDLRLAMSWHLAPRIRRAARKLRFAELAMLARIYCQIAGPFIIVGELPLKLKRTFESRALSR